MIQRVSLDETASSAAARSQTFIVLQRNDGTDHNHYRGHVNGTCIVAMYTHWFSLPLSILLLSTATQLWDGMGLDKSKTKFLTCTRYHTLMPIYRDKSKTWSVSVEYACFTYKTALSCPRSTIHPPVSMFHILLQRRKACTL